MRIGASPCAPRLAGAPLGLAELEAFLDPSRSDRGPLYIGSDQRADGPVDDAGKP